MAERIAVFGLGYIGCVTAACLARAGHHVTGVDLLPEKVAMLRDGVATVVEPGLAALVREVVQAGRLHATSSPAEAVQGARFSLVCVGSPGLPSGALDTTHVERVCEQIGAALRGGGERHIVVVRSTVLPGTLEERLIPAIERASEGRVGQRFDVCLNP